MKTSHPITRLLALLSGLTFLLNVGSVPRSFCVTPQ